MARKNYDWVDGAELEEHSRRKLKILSEYFSQYLSVRCQLPVQGRFRLAIIDGFAGAGQYRCGTYGSPLIFLNGLRDGIDAVNLRRTIQGLKTLEIDCLLILNDSSPDAITLLKRRVDIAHEQIKLVTDKLRIRIEYTAEDFEALYPKIKKRLASESYRNVLFNLDQCGHSGVERRTLCDILDSNHSPEIIYTFAIESLFTYLRRSDPAALSRQLKYIGLDSIDLESLQKVMNREAWLGAAERIVFTAFQDCASFVSPFSINNPEGWRYWLIHFSKVYRARQVYNDVLHQNSTMQAHFGRAGLDMLFYSPSHEDGSLYLFDQNGRHSACEELQNDIPRLIEQLGGEVRVGTFYEKIYNLTPAHSDDINLALVSNSDILVATPTGGHRRRAQAVDVNDTLKLKKQRSLFIY